MYLEKEKINCRELLLENNQSVPYQQSDTDTRDHHLSHALTFALPAPVTYNKQDSNTVSPEFRIAKLMNYLHKE